MQVMWYDLDFPHIIELRRKFIDDEGERYHLLACSVLEDAWLETVSVQRPRPFLFLAETVFVYFTEAQAKSLVLTLRDRFPGAELVFDGWRPFEVWLRLVQALAVRFPGAELACDAYAPVVVRFHPRPPAVPRPRWGLKDDRDIDSGCTQLNSPAAT